VLLLQGLGLLGDGFCGPFQFHDGVFDLLFGEWLNGRDVRGCSQLLDQTRFLQSGIPARSSRSASSQGTRA